MICITDHFTNSWKANVIRNLNSLDKIIMYLEEISQLQIFLRDEGEIMALLKGIEIDISSTEKFILNNISPNKFDIILFEYLDTIEGISFVKKILDFWKSSISKNINANKSERAEQANSALIFYESIIIKMPVPYK